jgi:hypothetical protein
VVEEKFALFAIFGAFFSKKLHDFCLFFLFFTLSKIYFGKGRKGFLLRTFYPKISCDFTAKETTSVGKPTSLPADNIKKDGKPVHYIKEYKLGGPS